MLDYIKTVLLKVSFNRYLFEKELRKAVRTLIPMELLLLRNWCYEQFATRYALILDRTFAPV